MRGERFVKVRVPSAADVPPAGGHAANRARWVRRNDDRPPAATPEHRAAPGSTATGEWTVSGRWGLS